MEQIKNFRDVHQALAAFVPPARSQRGAYTLERMRELMDKLGNPQNNYKVVHIAGTSGKTSTSYYIASMLQQAGKKVGLTVSPHIDEVNERVQINLKPLSEKKFSRGFQTFLRNVDKTGVKPTYFELLVAFAYWYFNREKVDYVVAEVGLGGLLDATNVVNRADKTCIITDIGLDHMEVLGKSLEEIAAQKAGIILPHNHVFTYDQPAAIRGVLQEVCRQLKAELHEVLSLPGKELPRNLPLYQRRNWYLASTVYDHIAAHDDLTELNKGQLIATTNTYIPARMEIVNIKEKTIIMDGAHNAQKMIAFSNSFAKAYPKERPATLFSLVQSKKSRSIGALEEIISISGHLILTSFETEQDMRKVSLNPLKIAEYCEELNFHNWEIESDPKKAFRKLLKRKEDILTVTGSFYLLNQIRPIIFKTK